MAQAGLEDAALKRIGDISVKIREAIRAALPTGKEQYLHVMVPGKVVDFDVSVSLHAICVGDAELVLFVLGLYR